MVVAGRKAKEREDDALRAQRATSGKPRGSHSHPTRASFPALSFLYASIDSLVSSTYVLRIDCALEELECCRIV